jgi:membrane-associated phospholipid phosphatase
VQQTTPLDKTHRATRALILLVRVPGDIRFSVAIAILIAMFDPRRWAAAAALLLSGISSGMNWLIKWIAGRHRPIKGIHPFAFHPFPQGFMGLFREPSLSFPSGDAAHAFAAAASLSILYPRGKWLFYFIAMLVAVERVMENAHYVSDVVAGAGLGILVGTVITTCVLSLAQGRRAALSQKSDFEMQPPT